MTRSSICRIIGPILAFTSMALFAADSKKTADAPVPAQIVTAKRVFIANGGDDFRFALGENRTYNQFYAAMKDWGHFELASSPADADLVYEASLIGQQEWYGTSAVLVPVLRLKILDAKSNVLLWQISEELEKKAGLVGAHRDSKFDKAMERLANDLEALVQTVSKSGK